MIYCVEDDDNIRELVIYTLESTGLKARGFAEGTAFMEALAFDTPELILLDIMLPKIDGITLLKWLRNQKKTTPVLLLTAKSSIEERVNGLDSGADDYLIKPFAFEELQARLRVLLRRNIAADPSDILIYEDLVMDTKKKKVKKGRGRRRA